jgi:hypothetical protein
MTVPTVFFGPFSSISSLGAPNSFGTLATYAAGTSTPQATYQDSALTILNQNPITLNALGQAFVFLTAGQAYKFICFDSLGNQLWSEDNVTGPVSTAQSLIPSVTNTYNIGSPAYTWANGYFGTALYVGGIPVLTYPITTQETTAGITPTNYLYPPGNVLRYGADPTGVADSTAAFQSALNSVSYIVSPTTIAQCLAHGGEVYVPRGLYTISSTLYLNANVHLVGEDCGPIQQSPLVETLPPGAAIISYTGGANTIAIDASGFWLVGQTGYSGTASAGASSTITITTGLTIGSAASITISSGTGAGQTRTIASYNSGTGVATVSWPWDTAPNNTSGWSIPDVAIGSRMTRLISQSENGLETYGIGSYSQGVAVKNLAIVATANQYMGLRFNVAPQGNAENLLISGFKTSFECTGCAYPILKNIISEATLIGFGWVQNDHATRINCMEFGVAATSTPLNSSNRPWFVDYMAQEGNDPNPSYWTAHYSVPQSSGTYLNCDGEGGDRSYFIGGGTGYEVFIGCHMERYNLIGAYFSNCTALWLGGDWFSNNASLPPAFSGVTCNVTIDSVLPDPGMSGNVVTIGSFPNTYGGRVTVRNCPPQAGDSRPAVGQLTVWDAYPPEISTTAVTTVGAATFTAQALIGGAITRGGTQSSGFSDTLPAASSCIAVIPGYATVGMSYQCQIFNKTTQTETLLPGSGVTFDGNLASSATIAAGASRVLTVQVTNVGTPAVTVLG